MPHYVATLQFRRVIKAKDYETAMKEAEDQFEDWLRDGTDSIVLEEEEA
jgi:hypothetical protein